MARTQHSLSLNSLPVANNMTVWFAGLAISIGFSQPVPSTVVSEPYLGKIEAPLEQQIALNSGEYISAQSEAPVDIQASFIVKFTGQPEVTELARNFRKDRLGTQIKFAQWARRHPALQGLILSSASYSGELILSLPTNDPLSRDPKEVLAAIREMESCAYAELDTMAYPSGGDR